MADYDHVLLVISAFLFALCLTLVCFGCEVVHTNCVWMNGVNACLMEVRRSPLDKPTKIWVVKNEPGYSVYPLSPDDSNFMSDASAATGMMPMPTLPVIPYLWGALCKGWESTPVRIRPLHPSSHHNIKLC